MSWRNLYPEGSGESASNRPENPEENGHGNGRENGAAPGRGVRQRMRHDLDPSQAGLSFEDDVDGRSEGVGATPAGGEDGQMIPLYSGEVIMGGMLSTLGQDDLGASTGALDVSGVADPHQGNDVNREGNPNRSRTPIRSGSLSLRGSNSSNGSSSDGRRPSRDGLAAVPEARRDLLCRMLESERCSCGDVNCSH